MVPAARDYTILATLGASIPVRLPSPLVIVMPFTAECHERSNIYICVSASQGIIVPSLCGSLITAFSDREVGYRVFWGVAGVFSLLTESASAAFLCQACACWGWALKNKKHLKPE